MKKENNSESDWEALPRWTKRVKLEDDISRNKRGLNRRYERRGGNCQHEGGRGRDCQAKGLRASDVAKIRKRVGMKGVNAKNKAN